jgi:electron transfer flavoprotein alpha subunit
MGEILVLAEHRRGEIRDVTWEMLARGRQLAKALDAEINVALLGKGLGHFAEALARNSNKVFLIDDARLEIFNSENYQAALTPLLIERRPLLTLISHSSMGMDLAPSLAARLRMPLATDCIGIDLEGTAWSVTRQLFGGKINAKVIFNRQAPSMATIRSGAFQITEGDSLNGKIIPLPSPLSDGALAKRFLEYVEAVLGDIDITKADILVAVGRGIKGVEHIPMAKELADAVGGTLACSRPVVDKRWLPKSCQVGTSGKTVRPKIYIALGISGAFQHMAGMKGAATIIAVNKDPKAPIFNIAHYGIVGDLFKVVPVLKEKVEGLRQR